MTKEEIQELKYDYDIKKIPTDPIRYHRLFADGRIKLHEKSGFVLDEKCDFCGYDHYSNVIKPLTHNILVDVNTWDGSDLFVPEEFGAYLLCSERFKNICEKYKLTGLEFRELPQSLDD